MTEPRTLIARLLNASDIARVVPRLPPEVLHRLIERYGLEECAEIVALATPRQLQRLLDIDLWHAPAPGADEGFDPDRFGLWLEVLMQSDAPAAVERLAAMDLDLVVEGFAAHVAVFDSGSAAPYVTLDGDEIPGRALGDGPVFDVGGFVVVAKRPTAWDAILQFLVHLQAERPAFFQEVMRACVGLSDGARETDGLDNLLDDRDQHRSDLTLDRETRRDSQGYVAPAQARAFLKAAREVRLDAAQPPIDPIVRASLRALVPEPPADDHKRLAGETAQAGDAAGAIVMDAPAETATMAILLDAGVLPPVRALLAATTTEPARLDLVNAFVDSHPPAVEALAFLVNALVSGGAVQGRAFTLAEASEAALATCNLGLENWPAAWPERDLVGAFQVGSVLLLRDVCRHAVATLADVLADLESSDRDVQKQVRALRRELKRHLKDEEPWLAAQALDVILILDASAWAGLVGLINECPTMHAAVTTRGLKKIDPAAFTFVSCNRDIATVRAWLTTLPSALAGS